MSRFDRNDNWAEPTRTSNATRRRVFDDEDDTANMQMTWRAQQSLHPCESTTTGAMTRRPAVRTRPSDRVESWRNEEHDNDLSGAMSRMRVSEQRPATSRPAARAARQRSPSPLPSPPPPRRRASPYSARARRAPSPDWEAEEPVRASEPRRAARPSPSPIENPFDTFALRRRTRNPLDFDEPAPTRSRTRLTPSDTSYSITTTTYSTSGGTSSRTSSTINGRRMRDTYRSTRHRSGAAHDPGCPFCFRSQGEAVRAAAEWCNTGEDCWVEWEAHGLGLWGLMFRHQECGGGCRGEIWYS